MTELEMFLGVLIGILGLMLVGVLAAMVFFLRPKKYTRKKVVTYYTPTPPTPYILEDGDLWINPVQHNKVYVWKRDDWKEVDL